LDTEDKLSIRSYVADLLKSQITYLENQMESLVYDDSIESLHHTRVMTRRIRNTIMVFADIIGKKRSKKWLSSLKKLTKSLTHTRDLDVQIQFLESELSKVSEQKLLAGLQRLLLRKQQRRDKKQIDVRESISSFEKENTLSEIKLFIESNPFEAENFVPPDSLRQIGLHNTDKLTKLCFSYVPFITSPDQTEALHNLRIAIKNLRYSVELFQPIFPELETYLTTFKKFQDDLGEIHDCDVWLKDLDNFLEKEKKRITEFYGQSGPFNFIKPGISYLTAEIKTRKIDIHEKFMEGWTEQFQNQFWTNLRLIFDHDQVL
jgi:CHAD domain-containing protein